MKARFNNTQAVHVVAATPKSIPVDLATRLERMTGALTATELAQLLHVGRNKPYQLAKASRIPHYNLGGMLRFDPVQVAAWLRAHELGRAA